MNMNLFCGCITHRFADVNKLGAYSSLQYKHDNAVVLKTCNRFEVYFSNKEYMNKLKEYYGNDMKFFSGKDCIRHLIEVCCGLDSMVVGENQILGQVKNAYTSANKASPNKKLSILFQRAIHIGKKVRAETKISSGNVSLATVAVEFAERIFGSLKGKNVLILGAGKMAKLLAKNIVNKKINPIIFANRTYEDAKYLAKQLNGKAIKFSELGKYLPKADLVLCATSAPHPIITRDNIEKFLRKKIVIIDISNPRNVDESVGLLKNVKLYTLDSMRKICEKNLEIRLNEVEKVKKIIDDEVERLSERFEMDSAEEIARKLYENIKNLRDREYEKAMSMLELRDNQKKVIKNMLDSLCSKFIATPMISLKKALKNGDKELIKATNKIFNLG